MRSGTPTLVDERGVTMSPSRTGEKDKLELNKSLCMSPCNTKMFVHSLSPSSLTCSRFPVLSSSLLGHCVLLSLIHSRDHASAPLKTEIGPVCASPLFPPSRQQHHDPILQPAPASRTGSVLPTYEHHLLSVQHGCTTFQTRLFFLQPQLLPPCPPPSSSGNCPSRCRMGFSSSTSTSKRGVVHG